MSPEMFRKLASLGLSHEQMAGVLEVIEADAEVRKSKVRERVKKWRNKQETLRNVTKQDETLRNGLRAREEDSSSKVVVSGEVRSPSAPASKGTRLPDDFEPDIQFALTEGLSLSQAKTEAAQFKDYWRAKAGKDGVKLDWQGTWRMWVRNTIKRRGQSPPQSNRPRNAGEAARLELIRRGEYPNASSLPTRPDDEGDGNSGFAGTDIARRIALAASR